MENVKSNSMIKDLKISIYFLKLSYHYEKKYIFIILLSCVTTAITPLINIIIPKYIIEEIMGTQVIHKIIIYISLLVLLNFLLNSMKGFFEEYAKIKNEKLILDFELNLGLKFMDHIPFAKLEDPVFQDFKEKALFPIVKQGSLKKLLEESAEVITLVISLIGLLTIMSTLSIPITILIIILSLVYFYSYKKIQNNSFKFNQKIIPINRKYTYFIHLVTDYTRAKDIRLYNMQNIIGKRIQTYNEETYSILNKLFKFNGKYSIFGNINLVLQLAIIYVYLTYVTLKGYISIASYTMYISAANQLITKINMLIQKIVDFRQNCNYLLYYVNLSKEATQAVEEDSGAELEEDVDTIEFKNVSFIYPNTDRIALDHINLTIQSKKKLALVGLNGAGKTTLIKLLVRLYQPTSGQILVNGKDIKFYNKRSYLAKLAVVFQDFNILSFTIKDNIALNLENIISDDIIENILERVGMLDQIKTYQNGIHSYVNKTFFNIGVELSGGQAQKVAISRLIFKDTQIVILDEPTSALDPVSEYDIYLNFTDIVQSGNINKIAIFISHRLSSCKICDSIAVLCDGKIIEYGDHMQLIKQKGLYYKMWIAQAEYYC